MIERPRHLARLRDLLSQFPVVGLIGARQVGKTTLAKAHPRRDPPAQENSAGEPAEVILPLDISKSEISAR